MADVKLLSCDLRAPKFDGAGFELRLANFF